MCERPARALSDEPALAPSSGVWKPLIQRLKDDASVQGSDEKAQLSAATALPSEHVVKVQLPLNRSERHPKMLIYSEDRETIHLYAEVTARFARELDRDPRKGYYRATLSGVMLEIHERVEDRPW
jgi:hypothetical protein